ncbi:aromatase/cyclase [Kitasatospora sp. NBC_01287]|uniref:aromatase/cyclase n=1 Tax=Kitasatospora sp. NBC_01287 TaxID=2903573 RepID=UPI00225054E5|nr:aromatase/cyclase [Kitasatospora sp. NBC_01287]MCX4748899.1 aromatase/cyclase [Kitasatospora sp. NBC_01287]
MALATTHVTRHRITVAAPPEAVFALIADAAGWPQVFGPTVHAEIEQGAAGGEQLLRIWAFANGEVRNWTSRRSLDPVGRRITFRQLVSSPPVAAMGGEWQVAAVEGGSEVVLLHDFAALDDDPAAVRWIEQAIDRNSAAELSALAAAAEAGADGVGVDGAEAEGAEAEGAEAHGALRFTFSDSVRIDGAATDVFDFLNRADQWPARLPHVARLDLSERDGVQYLEMDTRAPDGSVHTTTSVRVPFAERGTIVYKQVKVSPVMAAHTGRWVIEPDPDGGPGLLATSWHTVTLDPAGVAELLGPDATTAQARARVRHALGTNSATTLRHAKEFAEQRR